MTRIIDHSAAYFLNTQQLTATSCLIQPDQYPKSTAHCSNVACSQVHLEAHGYSKISAITKLPSSGRMVNYKAINDAPVQLIDQVLIISIAVTVFLGNQ